MVQLDDLTEEQRYALVVLDKFGKEVLEDNLYLQKIFFLITKLFPKEMQYFNNDYSAYNFGPYSTLVSETVERVKELGMLDSDTGELNEDGKRLLRRVESEDSNKFKELGKFLDKVEKLPKDELLYVIYNLYPEYATNSKIKDQIQSHIFESGVIKIDELKEGKEAIFTTDKGNKIRVVKRRERIVILD